MELRARFDEQNNIYWSEVLEKAGCHILYGTPGFKVHSKLCLITRREHDGYRYYTQVGTGNYNEKTAKLYTDLSLMSADPRLGKDAAEFFRSMGIGNLNGHYDALLVSPIRLKQTVLAVIESESRKGSAGHLFFKLNSLTDKDIITALSEASQAGVTIRMIIRGITCLLPGIPDVTDNIEIYSIVGRYLEHSRVYIFGQGETAKMYISSADFMTRNTERRVEVGCPVYAEETRVKIHTIVSMLWFDTVKGRRIVSDGRYEKITPQDPDLLQHPVDAQEKQMELAAETGRLPESDLQEERSAHAANRPTRPFGHRWRLPSRRSDENAEVGTGSPGNGDCDAKSGLFFGRCQGVFSRLFRR